LLHALLLSNAPVARQIDDHDDGGLSPYSTCFDLLHLLYNIFHNKLCNRSKATLQQKSTVGYTYYVTVLTDEFT